MTNNHEERRAASVERVDRALSELAAGRLILVRDDESRENEGDLVCAADAATEENIAFMAVHGRGLVCQAITSATAERLGLEPMARENTESHGTAFTVSVDAVHGTTTGISAQDRAKTIGTVVDPASSRSDLRRPGHVFPIVARDGGVLARPGHTEAAVDLARLVGFRPIGVICEVLNDDGTMARGPELEAMADRFGLELLTIEDLIRYRDSIGDVGLRPGPEAALPTEYGEFTVTMYRSDDPAATEAMLLASARVPEGDPLVRVHSECLTGESLGSARCDCGPQLATALSRIAKEGGYLVYLRQEGRGIGLYEKIRAYTLQDRGMDTIEANLALGHQADGRRFGVAAAILRDTGVKRIRLLTNNPEKASAFQYAGIEVTRREPIIVGQNTHNESYLSTKLHRMGHLMQHQP